MQTLQERYTAYFKANGCEERKSKSYKYLMFYCEKEQRYYHIGRRGSVRYSLTGAITASFSVVMRYRLEVWENSR